MLFAVYGASSPMTWQPVFSRDTTKRDRPQLQLAQRWPAVHVNVRVIQLTVEVVPACLGASKASQPDIVVQSFDDAIPKGTDVLQGTEENTKRKTKVRQKQRRWEQTPE